MIILAGALVGWGPADHLATALMAALLVLGLVIARAWPPRPQRCIRYFPLTPPAGR